MTILQLRRSRRAATQAEQEAGASGNVVTSAQQQFHPSAAKFWAHVTVSTGTPTLANSYNTTSVTDSGIGDLTVTIGNDFSSGDWCAFAQHEQAGAVKGNQCYIRSIVAGSIECLVTSSAPAAIDPDAWHIGGFGDQ